MALLKWKWNYKSQIAGAHWGNKRWNAIKGNNLQDATNADAKLFAVFGQPQVSMFELAGIVGKHLG